MEAQPKACNDENCICYVLHYKSPQKENKWKKTQDITKKKMLTRREGVKSNDKHIKLTKTTRGLERGRRNTNGNGNYDKWSATKWKMFYPFSP